MKLGLQDLSESWDINFLPRPLFPILQLFEV